MKTQDKESYSRADSGCPEATAYLGGVQSSCLNCPFEKCIYETKGRPVSPLRLRRNAEIMQMARQGAETKELAERFGVSRRTIERALKEQGQKSG